MRNVPELRFDGFDGEWEEVQLGTEADVRDGTHDSPKYVNKGYPLITSKNIVNGKLDFEDISFISEEDFYLISKRSKVDVGDIIMPMIGTIGNPIILYRDDFAIKNVALIKKSNNLNNQFLLNSLKSKAFYRYLHRENAGGTQKFIALGVIREFLFNSPTIEEQKKIGDLFRKIDGLIEKQEDKVAKMEAFKKSMLQKMFPKKGDLVPEFRFGGFDGEWLPMFLKDLVYSEYKGKAMMDKLILGGETEYLDTERLNGGTPILVDNDPDTTYNDILILWDGSKAGAIYTNFEGILGSTLRGFKINDGNDSYFIYSFLKMNENLIENKYRTPNIPHVVKDFSKVFEIKVPSLEEQEKIGQFFKNLDTQIENEEKLLDSYKMMKKSLLQKMFV